jgi:hypothetical protein
MLVRAVFMHAVLLSMIHGSWMAISISIFNLLQFDSDYGASRTTKRCGWNFLELWLRVKEVWNDENEMLGKW